MKQLKFLLAFCLPLICCKPQTQRGLAIPDHVLVIKGIARQQFPGTRVFVNKPQDYELVKQLIRFQKNDSTYFQVIENPETGFETRKAVIIKEYEDAVSSGKLTDVYYQKEFKLGDHSAVLYYRTLDKPGLEQIDLYFGDEDFSVGAIGRIPANDNISRDEVLKALLSLYVDKSMKADTSALANYTLDVSNTEFRYAANISQMFYYTIGGKGDPVNNPYENRIMVATLTAMKDNAALKNYAIELIESYKLGGLEIPDYKGNDITIDGKYAYEIIFNGRFKGRINTGCQIVTGDNTTSLVFVGTVYDRQEELMGQVRKIAQTLRIK